MLVVRLPAPVDPSRVEAVPTRAMVESTPAISVELAPLQLFRPSEAARGHLLTSAAVRQPAVQGGYDGLLAVAKRAGKKALKRAFGPETRMAIRLADDPATAAARVRAIVGDPRTTASDAG